jgi:hypothetical protein
METKEFISVLVMGAILGWMGGMLMGANLQQNGIESRCAEERGFWADDDQGVWFKCEKKEWDRE